MVRRAAVANLLCIVACSSFGGTGSEVTPPADAGTDSSSIDAATDTTAADASPIGCEPGMLARTQKTPTRLATDGVRVFWLEPEQRVMRVSLTDTSCTGTPVAEGAITALAVDGSFVVWADPKYHSLPTSDLSATPAVGTTSLHPSVVLNAGNAFWISEGKITTCKLPCTGGTTFASANVSGASLLATGGGIRVYHFGTVDSGLGVALWWNIAASPEGSSQGPLATQQNPRQLAATPVNVFWVNGSISSAQLLSIPQSGGDIVPLANVAGVTAIAAEEPSVYAAFNQQIRRYPTTSASNGEVVVSTTGIVTAMMVLGNDLIYAQDDRSIRRVPR